MRMDVSEAMGVKMRVSGGRGVKVYSKREVGMSGIRANETIYSGQNRYYCEKKD